MSATHVSASLRRLVRERAGECCEYCLIPEAMTWALHTIDHIIAEKHGGTTAAENLALACTLCNSRKGFTPARKFRMLLHTNPTRERGECLGTRARASEDM
jgi:5-methylcytosine-specific restriction endonuclease McrA